MAAHPLYRDPDLRLFHHQPRWRNVGRDLRRILAGHGIRLLQRPLTRLALRRLARDPDPLAPVLAGHLRRAATDTWSPQERTDFAAVEALRAAYVAGGPPTLPGSPDLARVATWVSKRPRWCRALYAVALAAPQPAALEYGTSIGISGAYLGRALRDRGGHLWTMEASPRHVAQARKTMEHLGLADTVEVLEGRFEDLAPDLLRRHGPIGLIFKDANHAGAPTVDSFDAALPHVAEGALFVFDDITWSRDMNEAWRRITKRPEVAFAVDLFNIGIVCVRPGGAGPGRCHRIALR